MHQIVNIKTKLYLTGITVKKNSSITNCIFLKQTIELTTNNDFLALSFQTAFGLTELQQQISDSTFTKTRAFKQYKFHIHTIGQKG